jgi:DNA mismatch repair ATPase MutS
MNQGNSTFGSISSLNSLKSSSRSSQSESRWKNLNDDLLHRDTQKCLKMHLNPKEPKKASKGVLMKKKLHERFQKLKKIGNFDLSFLDKEK